MAGIIKGRHSIAIFNREATSNSNELYISLYKAMELFKAAGYINRIALYYGDGGASGMDYWDEANPCGNNSFVVYQFPPYGSRTWSWYFLMQWCYGSSFGTAGKGSPGKIDGIAGYTGGNLGFQSAVGMTAGFADMNPWGGTTNNDGTDAKSDPVWNATNLWVYPRSNHGEGAFSSKKENCAIFMGDLASTTDDDTFANIFIDKDSLLIVKSGNQTYPAFGHFYAGPYIPVKDTTPTAPFVQFLTDKDMTTYTPFQDTYGGLAGTSDTDGGVFVESDKSVRPLLLSALDLDTVTARRNPNYSLSSAGVFSETPFAIYANETESVYGRELSGIVGYVDKNMISYISRNIGVGTTLNSSTRMVWGNTNKFAENKFTSPWDGSVPDMWSYGRDGVDF